MKTVLVNDLAEFVDIYDRNLDITSGKMAQLKRATKHLSSRTTKLTIAGVIFGVWCYRKIKTQQEQIKLLNKRMNELQEEQELQSSVSKEIDEMLQ